MVLGLSRSALLPSPPALSPEADIYKQHSPGSLTLWLLNGLGQQKKRQEIEVWNRERDWGFGFPRFLPTRLLSACTSSLKATALTGQISLIASALAGSGDQSHPLFHLDLGVCTASYTGWSRFFSLLTSVHAFANSSSLKLSARGSPGGSVVKNLSANTGDTGLIPDPGRSHMPWSNKAQKARVPQLYSLCSRAWEEQLLKPACPRTHALQQEKPVQCKQRVASSFLPQLEKAQAQ